MTMCIGTNLEVSSMNVHSNSFSLAEKTAKLIDARGKKNEQAWPGNLMLGVLTSEVIVEN